jgi:hypothetical protein
MRTRLVAIALSLGLIGCTAMKNVLLEHAVTFSYTLAPQKQNAETVAAVTSAAVRFAKSHGMGEVLGFHQYYPDSTVLPFVGSGRFHCRFSVDQKDGAIWLRLMNEASETDDFRQLRLEFEALLIQTVGADGFTMKQGTNYWVDAA